jgi:hypothetical protein
MRPIPSQKPHKVAKITEQSEEVRILYVKLLESVIFQNFDKDEIRLFIEDIVNLISTLCMDHSHLIIYDACVLMKNFTVVYKELLFYFNSTMSRAIFYALTHKQSKLRIAALDVLEKLMTCSPQKKNIEIMEQLIGFRDPNLVAIKDFYEPSTKINYLAMLVTDSNPAVKKRFFEMITNWLTELDDRVEHESRLIPYVLTGMFDSNEEIALMVVEKFEIIGKQYEIDNEKEIREERQYGIDSQWVKMCDENSYYPFPLSKRPRLGCRLLVKKYVRRYIKNLCKDFYAIEDAIRIRVANLILFSIIYAEDHLIEYLHEIFLCFERELSRSNEKWVKDIVDPIEKALRFLGRYCDYESVAKLIYPTIEVKLYN